MNVHELDRWEGLSLDEWQQRWGVPNLRVFRTLGSTNDIATETAEAGAPAGTLIMTEEQTRGRGRRGRTWVAPAGCSLSLSMILRPPTHDTSRLLTLRLGLAAARALDDVLGLHVGLKWPNDLQVDGRKVGGILCEGVALEDRPGWVIAGLGLNLRTPPDGWPEELTPRAGSLEDAAGRTLSAAAIAGALATAWLHAGSTTGGTLTDSELREFEARDTLRGRAITVAGEDTGDAAGITATGALRVRTETGISEVVAGTVRTLDSKNEARI